MKHLVSLEYDLTDEDEKNEYGMAMAADALACVLFALREYINRRMAVDGMGSEAVEEMEGVQNELHGQLAERDIGHLV